MSEFDDIMAEVARLDSEAKAADLAQRAKDAQKLLDLKRVHGAQNVAGVWAGGSLVAVQRPSQTKYAQFSDDAGTEGSDPKAHANRLRLALERLARQCLLYPDEVAYRELCKVHTALGIDAGKAARRLADDAEVIAEGKS